MSDKINYCDQDNECAQSSNIKAQSECKFYACESEPKTYCDHLAWWGGCICRDAIEEIK